MCVSQCLRIWRISSVLQTHKFLGYTSSFSMQARVYPGYSRNFTVFCKQSQPQHRWFRQHLSCRVIVVICKLHNEVCTRLSYLQRHARNSSHIRWSVETESDYSLTANTRARRVVSVNILTLYGQSLDNVLNLNILPEQWIRRTDLILSGTFLFWWTALNLILNILFQNIFVHRIQKS